MEDKLPILGVHLSINGGFRKLFREASRLKINTFQFFLGSPVVWKNIVLSNDDIMIFNKNAKKFKFITAHSPYLVNLSSSNFELRKKSVNRVIADLKELKKLSIINYVVHIGSNENVQQGIKNIRGSLQEIFSYYPEVRIILENSAGRKNDMGKNMEELREISEGFQDKIGICIDTCHLFASGVDIRKSGELNKFYDTLKRYSLLKNIAMIHLNDSKYPPGSFKDRHWHIGEGEIGEEGFFNLFNHHFFSHLPLILETPKQGDMDRVNIRRVKKIFVKLKKIYNRK